jgi:site-specific recombinase XerD
VAYGHDLRRLAAFAAGRRGLLALRQADLVEFIGTLRDAGLSARSVARSVHALRGLFRFAVREAKLTTDPMENLKAPRAFKALPRFLSAGGP